VHKKLNENLILNNYAGASDDLQKKAREGVVELEKSNDI
jgi:hypothetical protein